MADERSDQKKRLSNLSHDMRSPLGVIKANAQLLVKVLDKPETAKTLSLKIVESVDRIAEMIAKLEREL